MSRILLLEPDQVLGKIYRQALDRAGHQVVWCRAAQSAIHQLDKQPVEMIICELQLAGHNGVEFLYEIRSYGDWQKIPVVIISQVTMESTGFKNWEQLNVVDHLY